MPNASWDNETIIELIAKALDEPLAADEQTLVEQAMQAAPALRLVADGLNQFDALLKRTGMAIPDEGFPARVLLRIEAYERARTRTQWYLTLGLIFLGLFAALYWVALNGGAVVHLGVSIVASFITLFPLLLVFAITFLRWVVQGPLLVLALGAVVMTLLWVRVSGGFRADSKSW
jgi:hypothetical protein